MSRSTESTQPAAPTPDHRNSPVRDAVTIGIFIVLYIMLSFICDMTMGAISLIMVLLPVIFRIFGGLIFMVLLGKVQHTGIFLVTGLIIGLVMISMAPGGVMYCMAIADGMVAEVIYWLADHKSFTSMTVAYTAFVTFFALSEYIPFVWMKDVYLGLYANDPTLDVAKVGMGMLNPVTMAMYCLLAIMAYVAGRLWGRALTRRRFSHAGIAWRVTPGQSWTGSLFPGNLNS